MSPALKDLLFMIRQHAGYRDLLAEVAAPAAPRFRPTSPEPLETFGAKSIFAHGEAAQHERWLALLTGGPVPPQGETQPSHQEKP